jgi:cell division protein FtsQ
MNENRHRGRKKSGVLPVILLIGFLLVVLLVTSGLFFKVKDIVVEGNSVVSKDEIIDVSGLSLDDSILLINKTAAARSLISGLPYVKAVRIKRELPGTVVIIITEAGPAAKISYRGASWIFDAYGSLLEPVAVTARPDLPLVKGFALLDPVAGTRLYTGEDDEPKIEPLLTLLQIMIEEGLLKDVGEIDLSRLSNITFTYLNYKAELGQPDGFRRKIEVMLMALEDDRVSGAESGTFNLANAENRTVGFVPD